jgi:hypothetical protein
VLSPALAGLLAIAGAAADPFTGDGAALYEAYAAEPERLQFKATAYHFAYLFWAAAALMLAGLVRRRGSWLANVAGVLALLGISTMPGFILADFYDSAIGQQRAGQAGAPGQGAGGDLRVRDRTDERGTVTSPGGPLAPPSSARSVPISGLDRRRFPTYLE